MAKIVKEPPRELRRLAVRIDAGLGVYIRSWEADRAVGSRWEALRHAWTLSNLTIRHTEATTLMARTDAVLAPAAFVTARAAVETTARCIWLLEPDDEWEREARWLALLHEGARLGTRRQLAEDPTLRAQSESIRNFAEAVQAKLPEGTFVPGTPSADAMLSAYGTGLDSFYVLASQYSHGAELATRSYRANLGTDAGYGEMGKVADWLQPLSHAWDAATAGMLRLMQVTDVAMSPALRHVDTQVEDALSEFRKSLRRPIDRES